MILREEKKKGLF